MPVKAGTNLLTPERMKALYLQIKEAKARGLQIPPEAQILLEGKKEKKWPMGENGYFLKDDGKPYEPSPVHEAFIKSKARFSMLYGPRGCGKSGSGAQKAMFKIMQGLDGIIANPDFENMKISTWPEFKRWIPWDMVIPAHRRYRSPAWSPHQPFMLVFENGAKVYIKGGKDSSSSRGPNVNWFWYDEAGRDETGLSWQVTNAGVRVGDNPQSWCTETPKPMGHWSYQFFIEKEIPDEAKEAFEKAAGNDRILIEAFHATRADNEKHLDPTFYASLSVNYPSGWLRAQEFDGEFANEGGKIGDRSWFNGKILNQPPEKVKKRVRFWDLAGTEKKTAKDDPDESVGSLISSFEEMDEKGKKDTHYCIEHQACGYWSWEKLLNSIANVARHDGPFVTVVLEEEPGSGGKNQVAAVKEYFQRYPELRSHKVVGQRARDVGDRVMAANHWFSLASSGKMWIVKGEWNSIFLNQVDGFTQIEHDDRVTSVTGGMTYIRPFKMWNRTPFISL